jgi:hypothetical protein
MGTSSKREEAKAMARRLLEEYRRTGHQPPPRELVRLEEMAETGDGDDDDRS